MRCAVSCAVCASALPQGGRSDCRYCGARCRMRAYRIRLDAGGCRRADAQRRQLGGLRDALKQAGQDKAALQRSQNEAAEWAVLLEAEEAMLRAELTRLRQELQETQRQAAEAEESRAAKHDEAMASKLAEAERLRTVAQQNARQAQRQVEQLTEQEKKARRQLGQMHGEHQRTQEQLVEIAQALQVAQAAVADEKKASAAQSERLALAEQEAKRLTALVEKQHAELQKRREEQEQIVRERADFRRTQEALAAAESARKTAEERFQLEWAAKSRLLEHRDRLEYERAELYANDKRLRAKLQEVRDACDGLANERDRLLHELRRRPSAGPSRQMTEPRSLASTHLQSELNAARIEIASLQNQAFAVTSKLMAAELAQRRAEGQAEQLRSELAAAQVQINSRASEENTRIALAVMQALGQTGVGVAVSLLRNKFLEEEYLAKLEEEQKRPKKP